MFLYFFNNIVVPQSIRKYLKKLFGIIAKGGFPLKNILSQLMVKPYKKLVVSRPE